MDYQNGNFPVGFAVAGLIKDEMGKEAGKLTEAEKEDMIFRYRDSDNGKEKEKIKNVLSAEADFDNTFMGPGIG